ncbi:transporter substrate-binding domain-containing diguanylate cyclase [Aminipila luticellarii]|uniref:Diguanylate cyclase n=1 Tax=Aminipila luticellarii TaxID=2507160 RepID=A0A410PSG0_9FIRM|nr:diguanylate cyclase [Aminipila luticellarii]QAT41798.1 diguanylate cyclase [Aminipila luticellarii]
MSYKKRHTYVAVIIISIIIFSSFIPYTSYAEGKKQADIIKVGYFQLEGFNDVSRDGHFSGYGYEYLMEIAKYTGWDYDFVYKVRDPATGDEHRMTYEEALKMLEEGQVDIVCNVEKTEQTERAFLFPAFSLEEDYGVLSVRREDVKYSRKNLHTLDGITIGVWSGSTRNEEIKTYLTANHIPFKLVAFSTAEEIKKALAETKTVDAIYTNNIRCQEGERTLLRLKPGSFYAVTNKQKQELCDQLDGALEEITGKHPQFAAELYKKYYSCLKEEPIVWTPEEWEYMKQNPVIDVGIDAAFIPIEYYDKDERKASGIAGDVLDHITAVTGLTFNSIPYDRYRDIWKETDKDKVQLISTFGADYQWASAHHVRLTSAYLNIPVSVVSQYYIKDYTLPNLKVAVVKGYFLTDKIHKTMKYDHLVYCNSLKDCVAAVNKGTADITYIPTYSADYFGSHARYTRIRTYAVPDFNYKVCFAVPDDKDIRLYQIINKAINNIPQNEIDKIVFDNILFDGSQDGYFDYVYKYPIFTLAVICLLWMGILLVIYRNRKLERTVKKELQLNDEKIHIALAQTNMIVWEFDLVNKCIVRTKGTKSWIGMKDKMDNVPQSLIESGYVHPDSADAFVKMFQDILAGAKVASGLFKLKKRERDGGWAGQYIWEEIKMTNLFDEDGKAIRAVGLAEDVTDKINEELRLKDKASRDALTNLLNRTSFQAYVQDFLQKEYQKESISALIILDTDDFKRANDTHGHFYGDEVLKSIALKLTKLFRTEDLVGRLGGDEFIIFMKNAGSFENVEKKAKQICNSLVFEKDSLVTTCSAGIAIVPNGYVNYDLLYKYADEAMYEAKKCGKCRYVIYDASQIG